MRALRTLLLVLCGAVTLAAQGTVTPDDLIACAEQLLCGVRDVYTS